MATVTPTLTISSTDALVDTLSLSVTKALTVTGQSQYGKKLTTGSLVALAEASKFGESMVYLKNLSSDDNVRGSAPKIVVAFATNEEITIGTGEFALIPWDGGTDLKIKHNGTGSAPYCEFAIFEF
mgnify:FL=1|jgi:hypothetical protein|tara:strand:+ start:367 stop:744 length:378 start_codon:yes stop_codon:yes gene_type:complete